MKIHYLGLWMLIVPTITSAIPSETTPVVYRFASSPCQPEIIIQHNKATYQILANFTHCISVMQKSQLWAPVSLTIGNEKQILPVLPSKGILSFTVSQVNFMPHWGMDYD